MKKQICIMAMLTILITGCMSYWKGEPEVARNGVNLSANLAPAEFKDGGRFLLAIIEKHQARSQEVFRLYAPNEPQMGGVAWIDIPLNDVTEQWAKKNEDQTLWVKLKCKLDAFQAPYPTQPLIDPWGEVSQSSQVSFYSTPKVAFPRIPLIQEK